LTTLVVVTDLDGTLLDAETYGYEDARPALEALRAERIPLILCSSKTAVEIESLRRGLGLCDPFIVENGGAILIPEGAEGLEAPLKSREGGPLVVPLGTPRAALVTELAAIAAETGLALRGFAAMSAAEVAARTGLSLEGARQAQAREWDEPFVVQDGGVDPAEVRARLEAAVTHRAGLRITHGGHFFHLTGPHDKGRAVRQVLALYGPVHAIGLGDAANDVPMLAAVNDAILMPGRDGFIAAELLRALPRATTAPAPGPRGWNLAVQGALSRARRTSTLLHPA
jgi:mannosyl-3-phosphoglycerate phosphatase